MYITHIYVEYIRIRMYVLFIPCVSVYVGIRSMFTSVVYTERYEAMLDTL